MKPNKLKPHFAQADKAYKRYMELESIVDNFAESMRSADESFVGTYEEMTPKMRFIWQQYVEWAKAR